MPKIYFLDVEAACGAAARTGRVLVRLFNSSNEQIFSFSSFMLGWNREAIEHLRNEMAYATIEAPQHTATGWAVKGEKC